VAKLSQPTVALNTATASVGESAGAINLTITLSAAAPMTVTVNYATSDGTATAGSDYSATSGTLTFAPGVSSQSISMPILSDLSDEPNETLTLTLSAPSGARLGTPSAATITITDDDATPTVAWQTSSVSVSEAAGSALVTPRGCRRRATKRRRLKPAAHAYPQRCPARVPRPMRAAPRHARRAIGLR
jgi:hypothetical protein